VDLVAHQALIDDLGHWEEEIERRHIMLFPSLLAPAIGRPKKLSSVKLFLSGAVTSKVSLRYKRIIG
jgi:hypothetical protein